MSISEVDAAHTQDAAVSGDGASASTSKSGMTIDEQLLKAEELKAEGNQAFERGKLTEALGRWHYVSMTPYHGDG